MCSSWLEKGPISPWIFRKRYNQWRRRVHMRKRVCVLMCEVINSRKNIRNLLRGGVNVVLWCSRSSIPAGLVTVTYTPVKFTHETTQTSTGAQYIRDVLHWEWYSFPCLCRAFSSVCQEHWSKNRIKPPFKIDERFWVLGNFGRHPSWSLRGNCLWPYR